MNIMENSTGYCQATGTGTGTWDWDLGLGLGTGTWDLGPGNRIESRIENRESRTENQVRESRIETTPSLRR